jgi:hypothetical protein
MGQEGKKGDFVIAFPVKDPEIKMHSYLRLAA